MSTLPCKTYRTSFDVKNYYNQTTIPQVIANNMSGCFFLKHGVDLVSHWRCTSHRLCGIIFIYRLMGISTPPTLLFGISRPTQTQTVHKFLALFDMFFTTGHFCMCLFCKKTYYLHFNSWLSFVVFRGIYSCRDIAFKFI